MASMLATILTVLVTTRAALALVPANSNPVATLWTFPNETWIENLAVRANGDVLCTSLNRNAIYKVNPFDHIAETLHQFSSTDGCLGISETASDIFVVVTANVSLKTNTAWPGSAKIWRVDVRAWELGSPEPVSLVANLTHVVLPDGVATLPYDPSVVLVADAAKGVVWRINTADGKYSQAIDDPAFKPTDAVPLGVNGIRIQDDEMYFTNLATNAVGKIAITSNGDAAGPVQLLTSKALAADDFALSDNGTVYAAGFNTLWQVMADGRKTAFVGGPNSTVIQGITSARFGRTAVDEDVLYMSTQGGLLADPPGSAVHGGQLLAVNLNAVNSGDDNNDD